MQFDAPVILGNPTQSVTALGNITGAVTLPLSASLVTATVTGAVTWTFTSATDGVHGCLIKLTNGGAGAHTFPAAVKWPGGTAPTFTASGVDFVSVFSHDGVTFYASLVMKDVK